MYIYNKDSLRVKLHLVLILTIALKCKVRGIQRRVIVVQGGVHTNVLRIIPRRYIKNRKIRTEHTNVKHIIRPTTLRNTVEHLYTNTFWSRTNSQRKFGCTHRKSSYLRPWHTQREFAAILTSRIRCDIALDSLQCYFNGPIHTGSVFLLPICSDFFIVRFFHSRPFLLCNFCVILCCNWFNCCVFYHLYDSACA